jgi:hypothetical protein
MAVDHDLFLPDELRQKAVNHLRETLAEDAFEEIRALYKKDPDEWIIQHHFFAGMQFRNLLREVIKDSALPPVDYGDNQWYQNWDDYYVRVVEEAAGCYEQGA